MTFIFRTIDHVQLAAPAESEQICREFFHNILGMEEIEKPDSLKKNGGVWFRCGEQQLHIGIDSDFMPAKKAHPAFYIENLDELKKRLLEKQIKVQEDDRLSGYNRFYVNDPFGNRLEFLEIA
ncbi:VOC family protein [Sediminibacillus albus]|uniref:Catechol 2,3-dioxygenase n=1 Tax=Sediminibacillus albus TaxID=407036 RepID=A0A1G8VTC8_9BACI|nr:VOC family protein [Sediminibacillus albus]SDJ68705.1 Catechol 2,3-dioxygenase [Sediminibacillus albus]